LALGIYDALTEIASDKQSHTFTASYAMIAHMAMTSRRTVIRMMPLLAKLKLVDVRRNGRDGIQTASTYTLLRGECHSPSQPSDSQSLPLVTTPSDKRKKTLGTRTEESSEERENNNDEERKKKNDKNKALGNSLAEGQEKAFPKSSFKVLEEVSLSARQVECARDHVKWREYAQWCRSKSGTPTEKGFRTWHGKQRPQWKNKVKTPSWEPGYVFNGKFLPNDEAIALGEKDSSIIVKLRPAKRENGKIILL
jgi:hypothetical protein